MKNSEFAYWLQGLFEVSEAGRNPVKELTPEQIKTIRNHLNLSKAADGKLDEFGHWLEGALDMWESTIGLLHNNLMPENTLKVIRNRLNSHFKHVLDARFDNREVLQDIHDGLKETVESDSSERVKKAIEEFVNKIPEQNLPGGYHPGYPGSDLRLMC